MSRLPRDGRTRNLGVGVGGDGAGGLPKQPGNRRRPSRLKHLTTPPPARDRDGERQLQGDVVGMAKVQVSERRQNRQDRNSVVDGGAPAAVDTPAVRLPIRIPAGFRTTVAASSPMEKEHFGHCLRRARESRDISLAEVAQKTKVSRSILELLEKGDLDLLPVGVYSRGFIRSFARAVGADETEPLLLYERAVEARSVAERALSSTPVPDPPELHHQAQAEDETSAPRRGLGLAVFVIILLLIATITLSLLLRRPPPSGEGLSLGSVPPAVLTSRSAETTRGADKA